MKRILIFLPYVPYPLRRGTFQRVYNLTKELAQHFEVDLFCLSSEAEDEEHLPRFEAFCNRVKFEPFQNVPWAPFFTDRIWNPLPVTVRHWWSETALASFREFVAGQHYELISFCDLVLWPYVKEVFPVHPVRVMDRSRVDWLYQKEVLNTVEQGFFSKIKSLENLSKIARLEKEVREKLDLMVVCGPDDRTFLEEQLGPTNNIYVLANGADVEFFDASAWPQTSTPEPSALFCGALDYAPNVDGLGWYFEKIHHLVMERLPNFKVLLVGKNPTDEIRNHAKLPGVEFIGEVPDVRPYYQKAWMQIVPLRIGGGTRLKIAEGLAMANPVVSTTLGAQGLDLFHEKELLLADSPQEFADAIIRYASDEQLRKTHGANGHRAIHSLYTWNALGASLAERFNKLISNKP